MNITHIILICITCFASHCLGDKDEGKRISSSYSYSIEYDDSDNGNFGHKIEVKDGTARVNVRSENAKKFNSAVASKPGKPYLPQKKPVIYSKPKQEVAYVSAPESSVVIPQQYSAPQVHVQPKKNPAIEAALKKYSQEQLSILLSQNKNPFLPIDPKDSIHKFISQYQSSQYQGVPQTQPNTAYVPQVQSNNYLTQSYAQTPAVSTDSKSQFPTTYYSPSTPQQNSQVQPSYYQPQVQQSYQPASYGNLQQSAAPSHIPSVSQAAQGPVQYVYVPQNNPQTASHPVSSSQSVTAHLQTASYGTPQSGSVQFAQQSYQPVNTKQQYVPNTATYQSASYPSYSPTSQQVQQNAYGSAYASSVPSSADQGKQQYVTVPSSSAYQTSQVSQPSYQNVYGSSLTSQYPSAVSSSPYGSTSNIASYKPVTEGATQFSQGNFDFSKYAQYVPTSSQASPSVTYKPSEAGVPSSSNAAQYYSGLQKTTEGNFDFSKYAQYVPASNQASPTVTYKPSGAQPSSNTAQYFSGVPTPSAGNFDFSKYAQHVPSNQASPTVTFKPSGAQPSSNTAQYFSGVQTPSAGNFDFSKYAQHVPSNQASPTVTFKPSGDQPSSNTAQYFSGVPTPSAGNFDFSKYAQHVPSNQASPTVTFKPSETGLQSSSNAAQFFSGLPKTAGSNFDFSKYPQYLPTSNQASPSQSPNAAQYYSGLPTTPGATNYAAGPTGQDATKSNLFGSNAGHNLFAGLQSSQNYGSLFSGVTGATAQDAAKNNVIPQATQHGAAAYGSNVIQGSAYPQFGNSAVPSANYKPVVESPSPDTSAKLQYQSPNVNTILGSGNVNFDVSKFQSYGTGLANSQNNYNVPSGHNFNLNQISSVQATDSKYGQYAIDIRQGRNPSGGAQVMVQTNYNLGAQNAPASAASDNSNVRYVYVPSYAPSSPGSPDGSNHGK